ncbi:MAG: alanine racemase [Alphaproteobacteria bacterium]|nr:alanine racemase [Alphaproteobacteria bacterium]
MVPVEPAPATLTVDLDALVENWRGLKTRVGAADCAAVVKADGYGLGAAQIAPALARAGCSEFFVAHLSEAVALRATLPGANITVLNGVEAGTAEHLIRHGLRPALGSPGQIEVWAAAAKRAGRPLKAALHRDTGMNRLGLSAAESDALERQPSLLAGIEIELVMSHLACSDEPQHPLNASQLAAFAEWRRRYPTTKASFANSSGIFLGPAYHFDLARPGYALYGGNPTPDQPNPMRAVVTLTTRILQIRDALPQGSVGYGATHRFAKATRVATLAIGYADGFNRGASNRGAVLIGGRRAPIVGRVSMDLVTVDVTHLPHAATGDEAVLIGGELDIDAVGANAGTIGYEILTRLGSRPRRVYKGGQ